MFSFSLFIFTLANNFQAILTIFINFMCVTAKLILAKQTLDR